jgi:PAS domain S-box-containing protein
MRLREIRQLVESTSDPAFAVDREGLVVAWNAAAEALFGVAAAEAIDTPCRTLLRGMDECGAVCSADCTVRQAVERHHPVGNFDLQVETPQGRRWCNVSVLAAHDAQAGATYSIHIVRQIDLRKRLEVLVRDFVTSGTSLPADKSLELIATTRAPAKDVDLSERELEVLRLLAHGRTTARIADELGISHTTVNNHVQHILRKLDAHSRLEAVRRAEHAGLI